MPRKAFSIGRGCLPRLFFIIQFMVLLLGFSFATELLAHGQDILAGTDGVLTETLTHSGKKYIYLAEGLLSLAAFIRTKNVLVLFGIVVVAVFFNVVIKVAGV